jgi:hypothetical protein
MKSKEDNVDWDAQFALASKRFKSAKKKVFTAQKELDAAQLAATKAKLAYDISVLNSQDQE